MSRYMAVLSKRRSLVIVVASLLTVAAFGFACIQAVPFRIHSAARPNSKSAVYFSVESGVGTEGYYVYALRARWTPYLAQAP